MRFFSLFLAVLFLSCSRDTNLSKKLFSRHTADGTFYLYFKDERNYKEVYESEDTIAVSNGKYQKSKNLTLYDFSLENDKQLQNLVGTNVGSLEAYFKNGCIYFHYDYPELNFCPIPVKELPLNVKKKFDLR